MDIQQESQILTALARGLTPEIIASAEAVPRSVIEDLQAHSGTTIRKTRTALQKASASLDTPIRGLDISTYEGAPDFSKVINSGMQFAILRAGYGKNHIDKQFIRNISECNRLHLPCGVYWFSYALTAEEAAQEARYCLEAVKSHQLHYPIFYDLEYDSVRYAAQNGVTINKALATQMVSAFCTEIEKAAYYAAYYSNADYLQTMFDTQQLSKFDLWYAWYHTTNNRPNAGMWQYSNTGTVSGITGNVDLDYSLLDYPKIIKEAGLNHLTDSALSGYPEWQTDGFAFLIQQGIIASPLYWENRFGDPVTVGEMMGLLGKAFAAPS